MGRTNADVALLMQPGSSSSSSGSSNISGSNKHSLKWHPSQVLWSLC
jgi:hypothetical protein